MNTRASLEENFLGHLRLHRPIVEKVTRAYARTAADREDLGQEIVTQLWRAYPRYDERFPWAAWMYRIALNGAISFVRSESGRAGRFAATDVDAAPLGAEPSSQPDARMDVLLARIAELDDLNRALVLLYLDGYSYDDIAAIIGLSTTNTATKLQRLKGRLREQMRHDIQKEDGYGSR